MAILGSLLCPLSVLLATPGPTPVPAQSGRIEQITEQIANPQPPTPVWLVVLTGILALLFASSVFVVDWLIAATHEGAHAMAASTMGELKGVTLATRRSGKPHLTTVAYSDTSAALFGLFVGYLGPSLFGLAGAFLLSRDHVVATLWLAIVLLAALLWSIRNLFGGIVALLLGGFLLVVACSEAPAVQTVVAYLLVWSLLWRGIHYVLGAGSKAARERDRKNKKAKKTVSEHQALRDKTAVPRFLWVFFHLVLGVAALYLGAKLML